MYVCARECATRPSAHVRVYACMRYGSFATEPRIVQLVHITQFSNWFLFPLKPSQRYSYSRLKNTHSDFANGRACDLAPNIDVNEIDAAI